MSNIRFAGELREICRIVGKYLLQEMAALQAYEIVDCRLTSLEQLYENLVRDLHPDVSRGALMILGSYQSLIKPPMPIVEDE